MLSPLLMMLIMAATGIVVCLLIFTQIRLSRQLQKLKREFESFTEIVHGHNNDIRELYAASLIVDDHFSSLDEQIKFLSEIVSDPQHKDNVSSHPYSLAIQKVKGGANVSQLMQTSGLSQDEAALLIRLHGGKPKS